MQCVHCNWQNHASATECFNCNAPLPPTRASHRPAQRVDASKFERDYTPGFFTRLGATAVDAVLMAVTAIAGAVAVFAAHRWLGSGPAPVLAMSTAVLIGLFMPAFMDAWSAGSPGKRVFKLRVVDRAGERPGLMRAALRHGFKYLLNLGLPFVLHYLQSLLFGERAIHNWISGAYVVASASDTDDVRNAIAQQDQSGRRARAVVMTILAVLTALTVLLIVVAIILGRHADTAPH